MVDRNGADRLCRFILFIYILLIIVNIFVNSLIITLITLALAFWCFFRMFSRNLYKRQKENLFYLKYADKVKSFFLRQKNRFRDRKTHKYIKCTYCKSFLRVKRIKGKHTVRCPKCSKTFDTKI